MAYQNVGTPRFYVNVYEYLEAIGAISIGDSVRYLRTNPTETFIQKTHTDNDGFNDVSLLPNCPIAWKDLAGDKGFVALLGHNMAACNAQVLLSEGTPDYTSMQGITGIVNYAHVNGILSPEYDGFTIWTGDFTPFDQLGGNERTMQLRWESGQNWNEIDPNPYNGTDLKCNSIVIGNYYDMPHSPDLSLKLTYEYDGVKTQQTKGGATLSNAIYTKPPDWGILNTGIYEQYPRTLGCWGLEHPTDNRATAPNYRSGRRVWDLSFSYLSDTDVFPLNASSGYAATIGSESGYPDGSIVQVSGAGTATTTDDSYEFTSNIIDGTDFFSRVWNRVMGGHLPFIFNPSGGGTSPNNNPDQFAICRFDMDSLQYDQVAHNAYNVKLKIREVW